MARRQAPVQALNKWENNIMIMIEFPKPGGPEFGEPEREVSEARRKAWLKSRGKLAKISWTKWGKVIIIGKWAYQGFTTWVTQNLACWPSRMAKAMAQAEAQA